MRFDTEPFTIELLHRICDARVSSEVKAEEAFGVAQGLRETDEYLAVEPCAV